MLIKSCLMYFYINIGMLEWRLVHIEVGYIDTVY